MTPQTPAQIGVCSWSMLAETPQQMADVLKELGLRQLQLALVAHRDDAGVLDGVPEALAGVGAKVVSGMFGTIGEDYSTLDTIKVTGGIVPDAHWEENQQVAELSETELESTLDLIEATWDDLNHPDFAMGQLSELDVWLLQHSQEIEDR